MQTHNIIIVSLLILISSRYGVYSRADEAFRKLPIVFVYTTIPGSCGPLPDYFKEAIIQAKKTQNNVTTDIIVLSNFKQCRWALHDLQNSEETLQSVTIAESVAIKSIRSIEFEKKLKVILPKFDDDNNLLSSSLYRFFMLEDFMRNRSIPEVLHIEADNMIYGDFSSVLNSLRTGYKGLAAIPSVHKRFISTSSFWVGNITALKNINDFFLDLARNESALHSRYVSWLRGFACCKSVSQGGVYPDESGKGVKSWAVSDMTIVAYYRHLHHNEIKLLPLLPRADYKNEISGLVSAGVSSSIVSHSITSSANVQGHHQRHSYVNMSLYSRGGGDVGMDVGKGLFDCGVGGWGSHFDTSAGALHTSEGAITEVNDKITSKIVDSASINSGTLRTSSPADTVTRQSATVQPHSVPMASEFEAASVATRHIVELAVQRHNCTVRMLCTAMSVTSTQVSSQQKSSLRPAPSLGSSRSQSDLPAVGGLCMTRPCVRCGNHHSVSSGWNPLWTMHINRAKSIEPLRSEVCACSSAVALAVL